MTRETARQEREKEKEMVKQTVGKMPTPQQFANFQQLPKKKKIENNF